MEEPQLAGQLPRPNSQTLGKEMITWQWLPLGERRVSVKADFDRTDHSWHVSCETYLSTDLFFHTPDEAKLFAEALLSANNWQHIWKLHFVDYMLEQDALENEAEFNV